MLRTVLSVAALGSLLARSDAYVRPAQSARLRTGAPPGRGQHPSTMFAEPIPAPEALEQTAETEYPLWPAPYGTRKTVIREAIPGRMWLFEQRQGILYVQVSVRMTVIRLDSGGLLVYSPVAATKEVVDAMRELEGRHGKVKYVVLPTTGVEHKVFAGPFARNFPGCQLWVVPNQWSFPLQLPLAFLGFFGCDVRKLPPSSAVGSGKTVVPWAADDEIEHVVLGPLESKGAGGGFEEAAFFHRPSKTLLVCDALVSIPRDPPQVLQEGDVRALLFHARDKVEDVVEDTPETRRRGWQRIALFGFFFQPAALDVRTWPQAIEEKKRSGMRDFGWFDLYPFEWRSSWKDSFEALHAGGRLQVAPILKELIFNRKPEDVLGWVDDVAAWDFDKVVPCHLDAPVALTQEDWREAFSFLEDKGFELPKVELPSLSLPTIGDAGQRGGAGAPASSFRKAPLVKPRKGPMPTPLPEDDKFLRDTSDELEKANVVFPAQPRVRRK